MRTCRHLAKPQRRIHESELPSADAKLQILQLAIRRLTDAGYVFIGMDHFAKPDDELAVAQRQGRLHRNFQGYSTHAEADLMAFGVSAIGKVGPTYCQNYRTLDEYYDASIAGVLPVMRGLELTADDLLRRSIIQALMCHFELSIESIEIAHLIDFKSYFAEELADLREMEKAGLLSIDSQWITVQPQGPHAGARHRHGVRPLPAHRPRARTLLESHLAFRRAAPETAAPPWGAANECERGDQWLWIPSSCHCSSSACSAAAIASACAAASSAPWRCRSPAAEPRLAAAPRLQRRPHHQLRARRRHRRRGGRPQPAGRPGTAAAAGALRCGQPDAGRARLLPDRRDRLVGLGRARRPVALAPHPAAHRALPAGARRGAGAAAGHALGMAALRPGL